mgnify:CR=1 FL=1
MNKKDLSEMIARKLDIKRFEAYQFIDLLIETLVDQMGEKGKIMISNFGTFKVVEREKKRVINPNTRVVMTIPGKKVVKFIPSKNLKQTFK